MRGDALDWALALARAPGERLALRQRPLPDGIQPLLQIAAGNSPAALADAVAKSGESEEYLIDAARFYLREVLFHSGADAYRVLGVRRDASASQIKAHHRLLQRWLHPDRQSSDWDAIFAARVNAGWNHLRSEERRRQYDGDHPEAAVRDSPGTLDASGAGWVSSRLEVSTPSERWRQRAPLAALAVACVLLGALALQDLADDEASQAFDPSSGPTADGQVLVEPNERAPLAELRLPALARSVAPARDPTANGRKRVDVDAILSKPGSQPLPSAATQALIRSGPTTAGVAPDSKALAPSRSTSARAADTLVKSPPDAPAKSAGLPAGRGTNAPRGILPATVSDFSPQSVTVAKTDGDGSKVVNAGSPSASPSIPKVSAERVRLAQHTGNVLLAYLQRRSAAIPPIWDTLSAQRSAIDLRNSLAGVPASARSLPEWRIGGEKARLSVRLGAADGMNANFDATLVWREERWLVSEMSLEHQP